MTFNANSHFTSLTANILVAGQVVGALQSLKIDDNYNTVRVGQIGSPIDVVHLPGRVQVNLSARRMVVNQDLVMTYLRPALASGKLAIEETIATAAAASTTGPLTDAQKAEITNKTVNEYLAGSNFASHTGLAALEPSRYFNFTFDIEVKDPDGVIVYKVRECNVVSRSVTVDQGSIVISEDVTMFAKYIDYQVSANNQLYNVPN